MRKGSFLLLLSQQIFVPMLLTCRVGRCFVGRPAGRRESQRRLFSLAAEATAESRRKKRVVFLGTPAVAAATLEMLLKASTTNDFSVVACVSQPAAPKGRKKQLQSSDVALLAEQLGVEVILTPPTARDAYFLKQMRLLEPDLCVTAAYGQFLPQAFLDIPKKGTWNIHPSLLPKWRGAAPLQRSLEHGDTTVGVTVLQTVLAMDAGPIVAQVERPVTDDDASADDLLRELFATGADLLVDNLPRLWDDTITYADQDHDQATKAHKLDAKEAKLELHLDDDRNDDRSVAARARDKVRAFAPWPGTWVNVRRGDDDAEPQRLKVLAARLYDDAAGSDDDRASVVTLAPDGALLAPCADGSILAIRRVQPANGKPMDAAAYWNGLRGEPLRIVHD